MPEIRMNTASLCRSQFRRVAPSQFILRNGMEEVVGSIPTRSTKRPTWLPFCLTTTCDSGHSTSGITLA